jgi:hypothetical protein
MSEKYLLLERSIQHDLQIIAQIFKAIATATDSQTEADEASESELIVLAYRLHNLYNAFENIFQNIATTFENAVDDSARWHAQLLQRMRLDIRPLRPAVIDKAAYETLDELRRFRHLFRHSYDLELDAQRLQLVLTKALQLEPLYQPQMEQFLGFLRALQVDD